MNRLFEEVRAKFVPDISGSLRVRYFFCNEEEIIIIFGSPGFEPTHLRPVRSDETLSRGISPLRH